MSQDSFLKNLAEFIDDKPDSTPVPEESALPVPPSESASGSEAGPFTSSSDESYESSETDSEVVQRQSKRRRNRFEYRVSVEDALQRLLPIFISGFDQKWGAFGDVEDLGEFIALLKTLEDGRMATKFARAYATYSRN